MSHPLRTLSVLSQAFSNTFLGLAGAHWCRERAWNRERDYKTVRDEPDKQTLERCTQVGVTSGYPEKSPTTEHPEVFHKIQLFF